MKRVQGQSGTEILIRSVQVEIKRVERVGDGSHLNRKVGRPQDTAVGGQENPCDKENLNECQVQ